MSDARSEPGAKRQGRGRQPLKVLLVEDMENDAMLVLRQLEKDGFEPIHQRVYDPEAMTRALREKEWDVVLSDYSMPQFKAPDALAIMQKSGRDLPFIVISGTVGEDVAVETMRAGAHDYFMKGKLKRLGEAVRREMDAARQRQERKAIASELRDSEAKFSIAFTLSPLGVGIADLDGRLVEANQSLCEIVGFTRGEIIGKTVIEMGAMQSHERERIIQRAESAGGVLENTETRFHRPDGTVRHTLLSLHPISLQGQTHRLVSVFDITKRKQAEERQVLNGRLLEILNRPSEWEDLLRDLLAEIKNFTGFDAIAIRLRQEDDFPYHVYNGFSAEFVQQENSLKISNGDDAESDGPSRLQMGCTCGMVISGDTPRDHPLFTKDGSFWCNDTTALLGLPREKDPRRKPRNLCIKEGYKSIALIPVRSGKEIVGLLQLNNRSPNSLTLDFVQFFEEVCNSIGVFFLRTNLETSLHTERDRLKTLLEALPYGIMVMSRDYEVQYISPLLEREFGPVGGRKCYDYLHGYEEVCAWCNHEEVLAGEDVTWERQFAKNNKTYQLFDSQIKNEDGSLSKMEIFIDITERKQAEAELKESESRFRTLYSTMAQGVVYQDAEGRIIRANRAAERILGLSMDQMRDQASMVPHWRAIREDGSPFPDGEHPAMISLRTGKPVHGVTMGIAHHDDEDYRWIIIDAIPQDEGGEGIVYTTFSDITERKLAEVRQKELIEQLSQAQKMESVGRLAGGVAHDFNNMLSVILGYTDMALEKIPPEDPLHKDMRAVINAAQRSVDITRQLLAFARKQAINPKPLDINEAVEGMLKMLRRLIGEDINLVWRPCAGSAAIFMDHSQLDQVLANLCVNARDAIAGVGKLIIETDIVWLDENFIADREGFSPGQYVLLSISDDGCGIDKETIEYIFEPFFTTKEVGKGTGLGLSTVYGIVKQNDAFINVYSEPGQGTTFKIYLPLYTLPVEEKAEDGTAKTAEGFGETVLIVEDEGSILILATRILESLGYVVLRASTPSRALELAKKHAGKIDLLVTDVVMPEMNGYELAEKLHRLCPGLKVVYMSGYTEDVLADRRDVSQEANFIQKPFTMKEMAQKVRKTLDEKEN